MRNEDNLANSVFGKNQGSDFGALFRVAPPGTGPGYSYFVAMSDFDAKETLIENLIGQLAGLPSIGRKTAQRLAYHLLAQDSDAVNELARTLTDAKSRIHACTSCGNYTERELCRI